MALIRAVYKFSEKKWAKKTEIQQVGYLQQIPYVLETIARVNAGEMGEVLAPMLGMKRFGM